MINKIVKTHSVSKEENNLSNKTQALLFNQSSAFYSPVAYGFFDDVGDFFKKVGDTFIGGFKKFSEGIADGDFKKILTGIGEVDTPGWLCCIATDINVAYINLRSYFKFRHADFGKFVKQIALD